MEDVINPYAAPGAPLTGALPPPLPDEARALPLASRSERLAAAVVDRALYVACAVPLFVVAIARIEGALGLALALGIIGAAILFIYNLMLLADHGQTVGKRWLRIRIVRTDGSDADLGRLFGLRMLVPWLIGAFLGPFFVLPDLLCIFGSEKRCLHDMMADTVVIDA